MKKYMRLIIILVSFFNANQSHSFGYSYHWTEHMDWSLSFNLRSMFQYNLIYTLNDIHNTYSTIWMMCNEHYYTNCKGILTGLCGSVGITTDRLMDCVWDIKAPSDLCINITIDDYPSGDPFTDNYFSLTIRDKNETKSSAGITYYINQKVSNVITNNSQSLIILKIIKLFKVSRLTIRFQAIQCNIKVSFNSIIIIHQNSQNRPEGSNVSMKVLNSKRKDDLTLAVQPIQSNVEVRFNTIDSDVSLFTDSSQTFRLKPFVFFPRSQVTEYHFLIRTDTGLYVQVETNGIKYLTFHDGPTHGSPRINVNFQNRISASSFQMYVVYERDSKEGPDMDFNLSFHGIRMHNFRRVYLQVDQSIDTHISWDFTNTSKLVYKVIQMFCSEGSSCRIQFEIRQSYLEDNPQGFLCQFHGLVAKEQFYFIEEPAVQVGPLCSEQQVLLLKNALFTSPSVSMHFIMYSYGMSNSKGHILFPKKSSKQMCLQIINPCKICSLSPWAFFLYYTTVFAVNHDANKVVCTDEGTPVFQVTSDCATVRLIPSRFFNTNQTCQWQMVSLGYSNLKFTLSLRWEEKSKTVCSVNTNDMSFSNPVATEKYEGGIQIMEYQRYQFESRSHQFMVKYDCFVNHLFQVSVKVAKDRVRECKTVVLFPLKILLDVPKFDGPCYMFSLDITKYSFKFDVSFLSEWKSIRDYPSQFSVAAYKQISTSKQSKLLINQLKFTVVDKIYSSGIAYSYSFSGEQMPFVWQSYGQFLTIGVNVSGINEKPISIWIVVNAIFEADSLYTYLIEPYYDRMHIDLLDANCFKSSRYVVGKACFSIQSNFTGNWQEAEEFCNNQGGHLWSVDGAYEFKEVMRSHKVDWYLDEHLKEPVEYDRRINAVTLLRSSSVMYLGWKRNSNESIKWIDGSLVYFIMPHIPHKLAEFALNNSHRYSDKSSDRSRANEKEYQYLLSVIRLENRSSNHDQCLALIPSTGAWTFIDCHRKFYNVSFLCKYGTQNTSVSKVAQDGAAKTCRDTNEDFYCGNGWVWGHRMCLSLTYIQNVRITKKDLVLACKKIGGVTDFADVERNQISQLMELVLSYLGSNYLLYFRSNGQVDAFTSAKSISEVSNTLFRTPIDLPIDTTPGQQVGVVCMKRPKRQNCKEGYKACNNDECILETYFCDSRPHCIDSSDELNCTNDCSDSLYKDLYFECQDRSCIPISRLCDLMTDCKLGEDEVECPELVQYNTLWSPLVEKKQEQQCLRTDSNALNAMLYQQCNVTCTENLEPSKFFNFTNVDYTKYTCPFGSSVCYPKIHDCVRDKDFYGNTLPCEEAWQFQRCPVGSSCNNLFCKDKYICQNQNWCVPYRLVCNGNPECPLGDDESNCTSWTCKNMLRCSKENICVHSSEICDGILHCPLSGDDEAACEINCPENCTCLGRAILCLNPENVIHDRAPIAVIRLSPKHNIKKIKLRNAWFVDISNSSISDFREIKGLQIPKLVKLDLSNNPLVSFSWFSLNFKELKYLHLEQTGLERITKEFVSNFPKVTHLSLRNSQVYHIDVSISGMNELQQIDLMNTKLVHVSSMVFHKIDNLQELHLSSRNLETVSRDFLMIGLSKFSTNNIFLCCLKSEVLIEQCEGFSKVQRQNVCPLNLSKGIWIFQILLLLVIFMNILVMMHSYPRMRMSYFTLLFYSSVTALLIAAILIMFLVEQHKIGSSESLAVNFNKNLKCTLMAKSLFVLGIYYPFLSTLIYFETYRTSRSINTKKHCNKRYLILLTAVISILIGITQHMSNRDTPSPLCTIRLNFVEKLLISLVEGLICFVMTALNIVLAEHMKKTRIASGRKQTKTDKLILTRLTMYNIVVIISFGLHLIQYTVEIKKDIINVALLMFRLALALLIFPVAFVLTTRQYNCKVNRLFRSKSTHQ